MVFALVVVALGVSWPASAAADELPASIAASLPVSAPPIVSVVAADIDADGDVDVVATDSAVNLLIWVNDGTGRFTRKPPLPAREGHAGMPGPGVEDRTPDSEPYTASDAPTLDADIRPAFAQPLALTGVIHVFTGLRADRPRTTRSLRGPPAPASLL